MKINKLLRNVTDIFKSVDIDLSRRELFKVGYKATGVTITLALFPAAVTSILTKDNNYTVTTASLTTPETKNNTIDILGLNYLPPVDTLQDLFSTPDTSNGDVRFIMALDSTYIFNDNAWLLLG